MTTDINAEMPSHPGSTLIVPMAMTAPPASMSQSGMHLPISASTPNAASAAGPIPTPNSAMTTKSSQTPSPSASATSSHPSSSKRPARKSTLTQQQKNQKRQRATQDQLATLEMEFNKNPTPNGDTRIHIAEQINMTERSVQIWFQNRRAKIKLMAKKSLETGEDIDMIPESMRAYLAMQAAESGKGLTGFYGRTGLLGFGPGIFGSEHANQGKVLIHHLTCRSLSIGKWVRVGQNTMDLIIFYSPHNGTMTYYINNENAGYKIEYPFSYVKNIFLDNNEEDPNKAGGIVIELNQPPNFMMDCTPSATGFTVCSDFTENQQASQCLVHHLGGNPKILSGQLAKLISLEAFMTRHSPHNPHNMAAAAAAAATAATAAPGPVVPMVSPLVLDPAANHNMSASAPVSPIGVRPSSQPNFVQPHVGIFQETQWGINGMRQGMRPGPGHKRQRSRSVPMAIDFSLLQAPMPSFYIQQPGEPQPHHQQQQQQHQQPHQQPHSPGIYAPVPQNPGGMNPTGPSLRIDTQAGFGLDMRQYPMSATTAPSPPDYASPNFFAAPAPDVHGLSGGGTPASYTPYSAAFLSPMMNTQNLGVPAPSVSPLSFSGRSDPAIVDQSPPMTMMGRSASADIYNPLNGDLSAISDDGSNLNDMYSKHTINLPMHPQSPAPFGDAAQAELDMGQLVHFDAVDSASLSPESLPPQTAV